MHNQLTTHYLWLFCPEQEILQDSWPIGGRLGSKTFLPSSWGLFDRRLRAECLLQCVWRCFSHTPHTPAASPNPWVHLPTTFLLARLRPYYNPRVVLYSSCRKMVTSFSLSTWVGRPNVLELAVGQGVAHWYCHTTLVTPWYFVPLGDLLCTSTTLLFL